MIFAWTMLIIGVFIGTIILHTTVIKKLELNGIGITLIPISMSMIAYGLDVITR